MTFRRLPLLAQGIRFCCIAVCTLLISCKRVDISRMNSAEDMMITTNVWLHRTSRHVVTVSERDGMGLVDGNIKRIGYETKDRKHLLVAYIPWDSKSNETATLQTNLAKIDLKTGEVSSLSDVDGKITRSLQEITTFFPHE